MLFQLLNPYDIISAVTAIQFVAQLEVAFYFLVSCLMSIYVSMNLFSHFCFALCCWLRLLYCNTVSVHKPPHHNLPSNGRRRWWARSLKASTSGRPPRTPSPPSPTLSPWFSTRWINCAYLLVLLLPACLLRFFLFTAATFSPSGHHHQRWRWRAWSSYATVASGRKSRVA